MPKPSSAIIDLTTGSTFGNLVRFSTPIVIQGSFQVLYQLINRFWVGHLGKEEFAAVSVVFSIIFFMLSLVIGISIGAGIMIAQYMGAGRKDLVNATSRNFLVIGSACTLAASVLMAVLADPMLRALHTPADALPFARIYLVWVFVTLIFMFGYNAAAGIFRGLGDSRTPTIVVIWTTVLNAVIDPILIFGTRPIPGIPISGALAATLARLVGDVPPLGVAGAAIATAFCNLLGCIVVFTLLARLKGYVSLSPIGFRPNWTVIRDIFRLGIPTSGTLIMVSLASMLLQSLVNVHGTSAAAGFGVGIILDSLVMMPAQAIGMAMSTIAGQNIGAGRKERVRKSLAEAQLVSGVIGIVVAVTLALFPSAITSVFQPDPEDYQSVLPYVTMYLHIISIRYIGIALYFPIIGTIRGTGDATAALVISATNQLLICIPAALVLSRFMGFQGILWALVMTTVSALITGWIYYRSGRWATKALVTRPPDASD